MGRDKRPAVAETPASGKTPRTAVDPTDIANRRPSWRVANLDFAGPFHCNVSETVLREIITKLQSFETMRWDEIDKAGSHNIEVYRLCGEARKRLEELRQDDIDELYSLRLTGRRRIWGIREINVLRILWWDPEHDVYPVEKKNT